MAEVNICGQIIRVIFFILQVISIIFAIGLIAGGSYVIHNRGNYSEGFIIAGAVVMLVAGIIALLIAISGFLGAIFLSRFWLGIYIFCLGLIITLTIAACIVAAIFRKKIRREVSNAALEDFLAYRAPSDPEYNKEINELVDELQSSWECCGWNNLSNWYPDSPYFSSTGRFPNSCNCSITTDERCMNFTIIIVDQPPLRYPIWSDTCENGIVEVFERRLIIVAIVAAIFAAIQLILLMLACCLCCLIRSEKRRPHKPLSES